MKKPYAHNVVSNCRCISCHKPLKRNLIERVPDAQYCFKCYPKGKKNRTGAHKKKHSAESIAQNTNVTICPKIRKAV